MAAPLTKGEIEEALGRSALIDELAECERRADVHVKRAERITIGSKAQPERDRHERAAERMRLRAVELIERLWGEQTEEPKTWQEKIQALPREEALVVVEALLRRRPEVTPPDGMDEWELISIRDWLVDRISELPEDEREAWTR